MQVNDGTSLVPTNTELDKNNVQQGIDPATHHESNSTNVEPEHSPLVPTIEMDNTNVDSQILQQSQDIDLNQQEEVKEDMDTAQLIDAPILEGHHGIPQPKLDEKKSEEGPLEDPINAEGTQVIPMQEGDRDLEDVASSPTGNQAAPEPIANTLVPLAVPMNTVLNASPRSVNKVGANPTETKSSVQAKSSSDSLDHLMEEKKSTSQTFRSLI